MKFVETLLFIACIIKGYQGSVCRRKGNSSTVVPPSSTATTLKHQGNDDTEIPHPTTATTLKPAGNDDTEVPYPTTATTLEPSGPPCNIEVGVKYVTIDGEGVNICSSIVDDINACMKWCSDNEECNVWAYREKSKKCWIKREFSDREVRDDFTSGNKICGATIESTSASIECTAVTQTELITTESTKLDSCPNGWTSLASGCYRFLKAHNFKIAHTSCEKEGGLLVGENSQYEQEELSKFYKDSGISGAVWLGATDSQKEGEWIWIYMYFNGEPLVSRFNEPMTFNSWNTGEPNNKENEDCVVWDGDKSWNDVSCVWTEKNNNALCEYPGVWGEWSSLSEIDTCSRRCGGGKQRFRASRACNSARGCIGEQAGKGEKFILRDCNTRECKCIISNKRKGTVNDFCNNFPQKGNVENEEKRIFCGFDTDEKREALLCDQVSPAAADVLLNTILEKDKPSECKYDPTEVIDGDCGQLVQDKLSKQCFDKSCQEKQKEAQQKMDEVIEKTDKLYEEKTEESEVLVYLKEGQKILKGLTAKYKEYDDKQKEIMKNVVDKLKKNAKLSKLAKNKLKRAAFDTLKKSSVQKKSIKTVATELEAMKKKAGNIKKAHSSIKNKFGKVKKHLKGMSNADRLAKGTVAVGHILTSIGKFQKGDTMSVIGGVLDIANGIAQFLPPPASLVTGTISAVFNMFQGKGAPSTEDVIKDEFKKQKEWMEKKFDQIDTRFDELTDEVKQGFDKIESKLEKSIEELKKSIKDGLSRQTEEITDFLLVKAVSDQARLAMGQWRLLEEKLAFIIDNEDITHSESALSYILSQMQDFGNEAEKFNFRKFVKDECKGKSNQEMREYCQVLAFTSLMMDRTNEIILSKTMALVGNSQLKTINFNGLMQSRKDEAAKFLTEIFANTEEEEYSYISCGLSDQSKAKLSDEQKTNLLDYAAHLDPSLTLKKKLEQRQFCVDAVYTTRWVDAVQVKNKTLEDDINLCCKAGKKTQIKVCSRPRYGGVQCERPTLLTNSLRCEGYLSIGYCQGVKQNEFLRGTVMKQGEKLMSPNGKYALYMQGDGNLVLYRKKSNGQEVAYWASGTNGQCTGCTFHFQMDGKLILYDGQMKLIKYIQETRKERLALLDTGLLDLKNGNTIPAEFGTIVYRKTSEFKRIWSTSGINGDYHVTIWRPKSEPGYCILGDVAVQGYGKPSKPALLIKRTDATGKHTGEVDKPTDFEEKYTDTWTGADDDGSFWELKAPSGFTCLGARGEGSHDKPGDRGDFCCVKNDYVVKGLNSWIYNDSGSGGKNDVSIWEVISDRMGKHGVIGGNFLANDDTHDKPGPGYLLSGDGFRVIDE